MSFEITGKVALISGGATGLGYAYAIELLSKGAKGVTLADVAREGNEVATKIRKDFGDEKVIYVITDVTDYDQFENAFKQTIAAFGNIDILINNAGIMNDSIWQREIDINIKGTVNGILLALEKYIPIYKSGKEGIIVNVASVVAAHPLYSLPIYSGSKCAVIGLTLAWGQQLHYDRTNVRFVAICPGKMDTAMISDAAHRNLGDVYEELYNREVAEFPSQSAEICAFHSMEVIEQASNGTLWIVNNGERAYQYKPFDLFDPK